MNERIRSIRSGLCIMLSAVLVLAMNPASVVAADVGAIKGTLVDANGQPLLGFKVKVTDANGRSYESPPTGETGQFEVPNLPPGQYKYEIIDPQGKLVTVKIPPVQVNAGTSVSQPIAIVPAAGGAAGGGGAAGWIAWAAGGGAFLLSLFALLNSGDDDRDLDDLGSLTEIIP